LRGATSKDAGGGPRYMGSLKPNDMISILQTIKAARALQADRRIQLRRLKFFSRKKTKYECVKKIISGAFHW
jgi:hypothetical protein